MRVLVGFLGMMLSAGAGRTAALDQAAQGMLQEDPDSSYFVALSVQGTTAFNEARVLALQRYTAFQFAGVVFAHVTGSDILSWQSRPEVRSIDVIDDTAAHTFFKVMTHLQDVARYGDTGVLRPDVVNISLGPVRALVGRNASGEHAIRAAINEIVDGRKIPVVMSAGNDGPDVDTVNPWSRDTHALVVGATDASGLSFYERSSRFSQPAPDRPFMFAAEGVDTLGPRADCRPKSDAERAEDARGRLTERVGRGNEACWEIKSGTSFSAGNVTRMLCIVHQSLSALRVMGDPSTIPDGPVPLPVFVRSYIDYDFDSRHPAFKNRLADTRVHYGPVTVSIPLALRAAYVKLTVESSLDIRVKYEPETVLAILKAAARPVPGHGQEDVGFGFLSSANLVDRLRTMHASDLIRMLDDDDPRSPRWTEIARQLGDPLMLPAEVIEPIVSYCQSNDLILGLPVKDG
jgi:subtilisin family serine protease